MKLSNLYTTLLFSLCLLFQSCLDMNPEEQLSDGDMWQNRGQFEAFAKNFYGWTRDFGGLGMLTVMYKQTCLVQIPGIFSVMEHLPFHLPTKAIQMLMPIFVK